MALEMDLTNYPGWDYLVCLFYDLWNACPSTQRELAWATFSRLGWPAGFLNLWKGLHELTQCQ
eukprot:29503-Pyramimonas_sp.AAC.1